MFWSLILFQYATTQQITLTDQQDQSWIIYDQSGQSSLFYWQYPQCCNPPDLAIINATNSTNYTNQITIELTNYSIIGMTPTVDAKGDTIKSTIQSYNYSQLIIQNECLFSQTYTYSGMVEFEMRIENTITSQKFALKFNYWFECQYGDKDKIQFDWMQTIIFILACCCVYSFSKLSRIRSIKIKIPNPAQNPSLIRWIAAQAFQTEEKEVYFQGFRVNWIFFILYIIATVLFFLIVYFFKSWFEIFMILCVLLALFCGYFFLNEVQCFFSANYKLQTQILGSIRICDIISIFLSVIITTLYLIFHYPWYLSCIMALFISGSLARLFKVTNLRGITIIYLLIILFDCVYYFGLLTLTDVNYETSVLMYSNYPVLFELPQMKYDLNKVCAWLSILDVLIPGLSIAYLYRFDQNRNSKVYFVQGVIGLFIGNLFWLIAMISTSNSRIQIPQSIFVLPLIILFTSLWALKQGDFRIIWHGQFYDKLLMEAFISEYKDETTENELNNSRLDDNQIKDLVQGLQLDSQL